MTTTTASPTAVGTGTNKKQKTESSAVQSLIIIRHGDRWDYSHPGWIDTAKRKYDPPLSRLGHQQARETGFFLDRLLGSELGYQAQNRQSLSKDEQAPRITWLSSPFLRTLQTSTDILNVMKTIPTERIEILPEYSIFEMDGHDGKLHADLPPLLERSFYFPRLQPNHTSLFIPPLPEARKDFLARCDRVMEAFNGRYPYQPQTAIVMVTHAAACIGLARAASQSTLKDINPAGPCGIYRLTRTHQTDVWTIDPHDQVYENTESMLMNANNGAKVPSKGDSTSPSESLPKTFNLNGYLGHLSQIGKTTYPWNNFGDKSINKGYTGPPGKNCKP